MANPYLEKIAQAFEDELSQIAKEKVAAISPQAMKSIGLLGAGALTAEVLRRAEGDRRMGRAMRVQQSAY